MKKYGLIGHPLSHSFSQRYFSEKFKSENIRDSIFSNYDIPHINQIKDLLNNNKELIGLSVTIPHKQSILPFLDYSDKAVLEIGACNSVRISENKLYGYNTDQAGFQKSLQSKLLPHYKKGLILGTGGSSKAVAYVLKKMGIAYYFVSRRSSDSTNIIKYSSLTNELINDHKLIINCTPVGMFPNIQDCPEIPYEFITPKHFLFDLTYNPEETLFLKKGKDKGAVIKNGYDMLIYQAEASWQIWNEI